MTIGMRLACPLSRMRTPEGTIAVAPATTGSRPRVGENGVLVVVVGVDFHCVAMEDDERPQTSPWVHETNISHSMIWGTPLPF